MRVVAEEAGEKPAYVAAELGCSPGETAATKWFGPLARGVWAAANWFWVCCSASTYYNMYHSSPYCVAVPYTIIPMNASTCVGARVRRRLHVLAQHVVSLFLAAWSCEALGARFLPRFFSSGVQLSLLLFPAAVVVGPQYSGGYCAHGDHGAR